MLGSKILVGLNLSFQIGFYAFMNKYMMKSSVKLFHLPRILLFQFFASYHYDMKVMRYSMQEQYRVPLNDLFDLDEQFLFSNNEFRRLIKRTNDKYTHLVNPNFDLSQITADPTLQAKSDFEK